MKLFLASLTIVFTFILFSQSSYAQSKGGRWQFEDNGFDTADWDQLNNDGALIGQAGYASVPPLQEGNAYLLLDTANAHDYFRVDDSPDLDFDNENIGISAWIYPFVLDDVHYLVNKGRQDSNPITTNYAIRISKSKKLEFLIRDVSTNKAQTASSSFTIPLNQWTFVGVFYDFSAGKVYMWNDPAAAAADTLDFTTIPVANDDPLSIGSWYRADPASPSIKDFEGRMDDVRISGRLEDIIPVATGIQSTDQPVYSENKADMEIYPNPVSLSKNENRVNIRFKILRAEPLHITIYNVLGQQIYNSALQGAGEYQDFQWNMRDGLGKAVNSGFYFIRLKGSKINLTRRILIVH
ncbi:MAG: T9SS type A sorting domain-containing protein [Calditrichia bacterium]